MNTPQRLQGRETSLTNLITRVLLYVVAAFLCIPNGLFSDYYLCKNFPLDGQELCVDQSWQTALNLAIEKSFVFGKDFVFTYGPLGFLSTRTEIGIDRIYLIIFDFFVIANVVIILRYVWGTRPNLAKIAISLLFCYLAPFSDTSFMLLMIMLFWLHLAIEHVSARFFAIPLLVSLLSFFIKLNTSFLTIFIFYLYLAGWFLVHRKAGTGQILLALLLPVSLLLSAHLLNVDLVAYISTGAELIGKYNDSMNFISASVGKYTVVITIATCFSLFAFLFLLWKGRNRWQKMISLFAFALVIFVLFKQSVVRNDAFHLFAFFYFAPLLWLFYLIFFSTASRRTNYIVAIGSVAMVSVGIRPLTYYAKSEDFLPFRSVNYFSQLAFGADENQKIKSSQSFKLAEEIRNIIGSDSVDIIPSNINLIYFNNLNYNPRPVIQSYAAYSGKLMDLNRQKYEGPDAPEFIIFSSQTSDGRYGFFDDIKAKIAILEHYYVRQVFDFGGTEYLLLERKQVADGIIFSESVSKTLRIGQEYYVFNPNASYFAKVDIDYSWLGTVSRIFYQPLSLKIVFTLTDGTVREYRAVLPILESGVIINPYVETTADYGLLFGKENRELRKVRSFRIEPELENGFEEINKLNYSDQIIIESQEFIYGHE